MKFERWITFLFLGSGIALRFYALGSQSLMIDESSYTLPVIRMPSRQMIDTLLEIGTNPPVYYFIQKAILPIAGYSEAGLRFFSAFTDSVSILIAAWLGYRLAGSPGRLAAAWFMSFSPFALWMAQVGRPYAFSTTLAFCLFVFFLHLREHPGWNRGYLLGFGVIFTGLVTHYFFFMAVAALLSMAVLEIKKRRIFFRKWVIASLFGALSLIAWLRAFFSLPNPVLGIGWITAPSPTDFILTIWNLLSGYGGRQDPATLIFGLVAITFLFAAFINPQVRPLSSLLTIGGILAPIGAIWLFSQVRPIYIDRYLGTLLPFVCALIAIGAGNVGALFQPRFDGLRRFAVSALALFVIGVWAGWTYHTDPKYGLEDWRGLAAAIAQEDSEQIDVWGSEVEYLAAFLFYYEGIVNAIPGNEPPYCDRCWYILRQPYTMTHAFTSSLTDPERVWKPEPPPVCSHSPSWSGVGLELWQVNCVQAR